MTLPAYASGEKPKKKRHGKAIPTGRHRTAWAPPATKRIPRKDHIFFLGQNKGLLGGSSQLVSGW